MRLKSLAPLYVVLVLGLAAIGAANQERHHRQANLIEHKAQLHSEIAGLRAEAAHVTGPLAVGSWARSNGMIPAPDVPDIRHAAVYPAPEAATRDRGLEVRTVWQ